MLAGFCALNSDFIEEGKSPGGSITDFWESCSVTFTLNIFMIIHSWSWTVLFLRELYKTSKTPYVAIDERGLVRSTHLFLFSCVH